MHEKTVDAQPIYLFLSETRQSERQEDNRRLCKRQEHLFSSLNGGCVMKVFRRFFVIMFILMIYTGFCSVWAAPLINSYYPADPQRSATITYEEDRTITGDEGANETLSFRIALYGTASANMPVLVQVHEWIEAPTPADEDDYGFLRMEQLGGLVPGEYSFIMLYFQYKPQRGNQDDWWFGTHWDGSCKMWAHEAVMDIVREVIASTLTDYDSRFSGVTVDANRVYMFGHSIGGTGSWQLGIRNGDVFAAMHAHAGFARFYGDVAGFQGQFETDIVGSSTDGILMDGTSYPARDYSDLSWWLTNIQDPSFETPFVFITGGTTDDATPIGAAGDLMTPVFDQQKRGFFFYRHTGGHSDGVFVRMNWMWNIRLNQSYLAFTNRSGYGITPAQAVSPWLSEWDENLDGVNNLTELYWEPSSIVDQLGHYEVNIVGTGTADVTLRRLQNFQVTAGGSYRYWLDSQSGAGTLVTADSNGLLTIPAISGGHKLIVEPEGGVTDPPPSVSTGTADNIGDNSATLHGTVNPNGFSTTYYFEYGETTSYGTQTFPQNAGSGTSAVSVQANATLLSAGATYHYRLVATNTNGTTAGSDKTLTTSGGGPVTTPPSVVTGPASGLADAAAILYGSVNPNGVATNYHFEYGVSKSYGSSTTSTSAGSGTTASSVNTSISSLQAGTLYHYRLVATSADGTGYGGDRTFMTTGGGGTSGDPDATPPSTTQKLIFMHHSCGGYWLADTGQTNAGGLGTALMNNNYFVSATNYGWTVGDDAIGDRTDIPNWPEWFGNTTVMNALFSETDQNPGGFGSWTRTTDPGGENDIIMFKSCYPNSHMAGNPGDAPLSQPDPTIWDSSTNTVANSKAVFNQLLTYFQNYPDKLFVVITSPPMASFENDNATTAANGRALHNWLIDNWLADSGYSLNNVAIWDFYNVLTDADNHHRWNSGSEQHVIDAGSDNFSAYASEDSHPNATGNLKATSEYVPLLNYFYNRWKGNSGTSTTDPLGQAIRVLQILANMHSESGLDAVGISEVGLDDAVFYLQTAAENRTSG